MQKLSDQEIAQCLLKDEKFSCNIINSCIQEAADNNLRSDWQDCLQTSQQMQKQVFDTMSQKGWYSPAKADMQQMSQVQNQFSQNQLQ